MFTFSEVGNTEAHETKRRTSQPDSGLATIPTRCFRPCLILGGIKNMGDSNSFSSSSDTFFRFPAERDHPFLLFSVTQLGKHIQVLQGSRVAHYPAAAPDLFQESRSWCKCRNMPAHAGASGLEPGGPVLRTAAPCVLDSFRGYDPKRRLCDRKKTLTHFKNPCDVPLKSSGITPEPSHRKEVRKENECYRDQKGNRSNVAKH